MKDRGWLKQERLVRKFFINGRLTSSEQIRYRITDIGVIHFTGPSKFSAENQFSGINITNVQGIMIVGNNNLVQSENKALYQALDELGQIVRGTEKFSDTDKIDLQSDIETIKNQLGKKTPDEIVIKTIWAEIKEKLKNAAELAGAISTIASLISRFIH